MCAPLCIAIIRNRVQKGQVAIIPKVQMGESEAPSPSIASSLMHPEKVQRVQPLHKRHPHVATNEGGDDSPTAGGGITIALAFSFFFYFMADRPGDRQPLCN